MTAMTLVPVERPTALENQATAIALHGQDLWLCNIMNVHVLPGKLDLERFKAAVARTAARYPPVAGRLVREGDSWRIDLVNEPIPVFITDGRDIPVPASPALPSFPFSAGWVVQSPEDVRSLVIPPGYDQPRPRGGGTEPLLLINVTQWESKTTVGISFHHTIGDARSFYDFTLTLSALYLDLDAPQSKLPPTPSFYRHAFPSSSPSGSSPCVADDLLSRLPKLAQGSKEAREKAGASDDLIHLRFPAQSLQRILTSLGQPSFGDSGATLKISAHDALMGYLISTLDRCLPRPVRRVVTIVDSRAPLRFLGSKNFPAFANPAAFGNNCLPLTSHPIPEAYRQSPLAVAQVIRANVQTARDPNLVESWWSGVSDLLLRAANAPPADKCGVSVPGEEFDVTINSNYKFDWNSADFGFHGTSRFHTHRASPRYFRVHIANPHGSEGFAPKEAAASLRDAEVSLKIAKDPRGKFVALIRMDHPDVVSDHEYAVPNSTAVTPTSTSHIVAQCFILVLFVLSVNGALTDGYQPRSYGDWKPPRYDVLRLREWKNL